jgi:opacity protein-like surface antigen
VLTVLAIGVVAAVVVVASVLAARQDVREATRRPAASRSSSVPPLATDRIEFTTSSGSGVLEIVDHGWDTDGSHTDEPGSLLTVAVELTCQSGTLSYGPDSFQAFDRGGDLFDAEVLPDSPTALEYGTLSAGQQVSGTVAFDIPRGGVTLLMSDESSRTVTALKVPD